MTHPLRPISWLLAMSLMLAASLPARAADPINKTYWGDVAIEGYDPVAYFTEGRAVEGNKQWSMTWKDAHWRFSSAEHLEKFRADPTAYAPQYGGYCAFALAKNKLAGIDPQAWTVHDGRLYLNYNLSIRDQWRQQQSEFIAKADANWPAIVE